MPLRGYPELTDCPASLGRTIVNNKLFLHQERGLPVPFQTSPRSGTPPLSVDSTLMSIFAALTVHLLDNCAVLITGKSTLSEANCVWTHLPSLPGEERPHSTLLTDLSNSRTIMQ